MKEKYLKYRIRLIVSGLCVVIMGAGCASRGEPIKPEEVALPSQYERSIGALEGISPLWWSHFGSRELERLIEEALALSPDLLSATEKIEQAELSLKVAGASLFPSLGLSGSSGEKASAPKGSSQFDSSHASSTSLSLSYELDLWGKIRASKRAAEATLKVNRYDYETIKLSLIAGVAEGYFRYIATQERLELARENLAIAERLLKIVQERYRQGAVSALDVSSQTSTLLSQKASLKSLELEERQYWSALAILTGQAPQGFALAGARLERVLIPRVEAGVPSDILRARPDVASALAQIEANEALVDVAYASLFPTFSLTGAGGLASESLLSLADPTSTLSLSLGVTQNLLDGGKLRYALLSEQSKARVALESYKKTILVALKEVEDALNGVYYGAEREKIQEELIAQSKRSLGLAEIRYKEGLIDVSVLLDSQKTLFSAQDQGIQQRLTHLLALLSLHKALGGGWQKSE